jgi:alanine racemase
MSLLLPDRLAHRGQPRTDGAPSTASARTDEPGRRVDAAVPAHDGRRAAPMLSIDLDAVTANVRTIRARTRAEVMAVVKADGFGHGMTAVAVAAIAGGATRFGVTSIAEALELRRAGFTQRVLSWLNPIGADMAQAMAAQIELAVPGVEHLTAISQAARAFDTGLTLVTGRATARIHLQLDTGMARDGAAPDAWPELCRAARVAEIDGAVDVVGVMGHLPCAAIPGHPANERGKRLFDWAIGVARDAGLSPTDRHLAATAATLTDPASHHTLCRIGAGLVGIDESGTTRLRHALTLTAPLVSVRAVAEGTGVGYGHAWTAPSATRLGLIPLGYADGLPRAATGRAEVLVAGVRRPLVGRISMDSAVVDLGPGTAAGAAEIGDVVTVFGTGTGAHGDAPTTADWARWADTLEHEIVTGLGPRIVRRVGRPE